jgi:hypothetical protein
VTGIFHACTSCGAPAIAGDRVCPCGGRIARDRARLDTYALAEERVLFRVQVHEAKLAAFPAARRWWLQQALRTLRRCQRLLQRAREAAAE